MLKVKNIFQKEHADLVKEFTDEEIEQFKKVEDGWLRFKIVYAHLRERPIKLSDYGKNYDKGLAKKNEGNSYFANKEYEQAISCYNEGIILCPQNDIEPLNLFSFLLANRSACLFELKRYKDAITDINYVLSLKDCPEKIKYKLYLRKANCYKNMMAYIHLASDIYKMAMLNLDSSELDKKAIENKKSQINAILDELKILNKPQSKPVENTVSTKNKLIKRNKTYINASSSVNFSYTEELGRFAMASKDISAGETIIDEMAHCAVLAGEFVFKNCQYCLLATDKPLPCDLCSRVIFCSQECKEAAQQYHKYECSFQPTLFASGASINCSMALRIITQQPLTYFQGISSDITKNSVNPIIHNSSDYKCVYNLCRNENHCTVDICFSYTVMAAYLLRLLKTSTYFDSIKDDPILEETEGFLGGLILRNLEILQFNAHEISELHKAPPGPLDALNEENCKAVYVGGGLYPTLALFNHSCEPSIVRYNIGSRMIVDTIKPIKKGEIIYENYGPIYSSTVLEERRSTLRERYCFQCECVACTNNWPLFKDMSDNVVRIRCSNKNCSNYFYLNNTLDPIVSCNSCNTKTNILLVLKALAGLEMILPKAEELYKSQKYEDAMKLYLSAIQIYYKYSIPPFPDLIKVHQRLRTCIVYQGNKGLDYLKSNTLKNM